ncbi:MULTISPECIES: malate synthase A [Vibrio]|uniref:Malate synthase n=1 Tax=Vibrio natriegens NBRC 15636 = ATCC 14048 = DSM 759 TaxID=1219067 RepID=A0AAN0Y0Q1_VIBNA|nr:MULTISPECIES: malate synthase A [Vibrio]AEX21031.1 malate synthase [Vibrio sp. EJY3]ALR16390.1 malate synthase [Vibrio natriegens NBRC 15636 = ATCC 14048 = DSM 759]ANQ11746.1 malate synthase A [Vibrio natriegens NBRC 15636 = ATCC 14048 = DSM 759]EPM41657.1 malate synthase [Vibrio natriegens NBRC 15636 = ATCC 14048 = DSM 759]MDX6026087.1 malate synthase A [Vibrio natriegens NBRC 15636 = ATCC 14048 = DSM 759]
MLAQTEQKTQPTKQTQGMLEVTGALAPEHQAIFPSEAQTFLSLLCEKYAGRVEQLLQAREEKQARIDAGELPDFLPETQDIREGSWKILGIPQDLQDRRVEITGPTDRKMVINALNANVKVFMADFEDSMSPAWTKVLDGQVNLRDAVNGTISYTNPGNGKHYQLADDPAVLICRVRGLHLKEKHVTWHGQIIPGALFDFALYFYNNYKTLLQKGSGPYFYIPKLQSHHEAKWWSEVFHFTEEYFGLETGTIKATVLIETLPAVFEMDEILFSLKEHIVGLNCGRWDYIFSYIKTLKNHPDRVLPDRQVVTMDKPFLNAYSRLLVRTCHKRGAFAMGGMAAFIPAKDQEENQKVLDKIHNDKSLEANNGHDGTWVAHPGLADTAMEVFSNILGERSNQLEVSRSEDAPITAAELLEPCEGERTEQGMRHNIRVALQYIEAWISGNGCVPIYGLMEDAATAEISRASIWQWIQHGKSLDNGQQVTKELFESYLKEEVEVVKQEIGEERYQAGRFEEAAQLMAKLTTSDELTNFLTIPGYDYLD